MADLFFSYARADLIDQGGGRFPGLRDEPRCMVRRIEGLLKQLKIEVWRDSGLLPGIEYQREINEALTHSKVVLVCWSPVSVKSDWVRAEADAGRMRGKLIAAIIRPTELPVPFNLVHSTDLVSWNGRPSALEWQTLAKGLGRLLNRPGLPEYCQHLDTGTHEAWTDWLTRYKNDPLASDALEIANQLYRESLARLIRPTTGIGASAGANGATADEEANVIYTISPQRMAEILQDMGYRATVETMSSGRSILRTRLGGRSVGVFFYGDDPTNSTSIQLSVVFEGSQGCSLADLNGVNALRRFSKLYLDKDGDLTLEQDVILRGGVHLENLKAQVDLFEAAASSIEATLSEIQGK